MKSHELRALARENLAGKWKKAAWMTFIYVFITFIISFALGLIPFLGTIASFLISPVMTFGFLVSLIKLCRNENPTDFEFLKDGFGSFTKLWAIVFRVLLKMLLPILFIFISAALVGIGTIRGEAITLIGFILYVASIFYAVVKSLLYSLTSYILAYEQNLSAKEIVEKSEFLMKGNRWRIFCLELSFIGWALLAILTLGIGTFWLTPYMEISFLKFYEELNGSTSTSAETNNDSLS